MFENYKIKRTVLTLNKLTRSLNNAVERVSYSFFTSCFSIVFLKSKLNSCKRDCAVSNLTLQHHYKSKTIQNLCDNISEGCNHILTNG